MIIPIDDNWRIKGTSMCWQLEKKKKLKDSFEWKPQKYFASFEMALSEAAQREIREHPAVGIDAAIKAVEQVCARYGAQFDVEISRG